MENQIASLIGEVCSLCYRINVSSKKFYVFQDWAGHVSRLHVRVTTKDNVLHWLAKAEGYIHEDAEGVKLFGHPESFLIELRNNLDYIFEYDELPEGIARENENGEMLLA